MTASNTIMEEIVERKCRAGYLILVGVKDCSSDNRNDRKAHDEKRVKKLLTNINHGGELSGEVAAFWTS